MALKEESDNAVSNAPSHTLPQCDEEGTISHNDEDVISNYLEGWPLRVTAMAFDFLSFSGYAYSLINKYY